MNIRLARTKIQAISVKQASQRSVKSQLHLINLFKKSYMPCLTAYCGLFALTNCLQAVLDTQLSCIMDTWLAELINIKTLLIPAGV